MLITIYYSFKLNTSHCYGYCMSFFLPKNCTFRVFFSLLKKAKAGCHFKMVLFNGRQSLRWWMNEWLIGKAKSLEREKLDKSYKILLETFVAKRNFLDDQYIRIKRVLKCVQCLKNRYTLFKKVITLYINYRLAQWFSTFGCWPPTKPN